uniref:Uncharacterized protein n=1 Tax=Arundo donax TaxID=35708 RepID=A0A0A8ZIW3_ARUDO
MSCVLFQSNRVCICIPLISHSCIYRSATAL